MLVRVVLHAGETEVEKNAALWACEGNIPTVQIASGGFRSLKSSDIDCRCGQICMLSFALTYIIPRQYNMGCT